MAGNVREKNPDSAVLSARAGDDSEVDGGRNGPPLSTADILASVGEAVYVWDIGSDHLVWSDNAREVLRADGGKISTGRGYAQLIDSDGGVNRFDAVFQAKERDQGHGVFYRVEYCIRSDPAAENKLWLEDCGRWFAGPDGKPIHAQGTVRVINERHEREQQLNLLARCDELTGEPNRHYLVDALQKTLDEATRFRSSCGFFLVAIDNLARINESYGFDIADQAIAALGKRMRKLMRGKDMLGRYAGNKFGIVLCDCTPDDMNVAAERLLAGVRDELTATSAGPIAVTVSIGGVIAPRHARTVAEVLARAEETLGAAKSKQRGSFFAYHPNLEREAQRRENVRATDEIVAALNERRIFIAYEPVVTARDRRPAFYECLMRVHRADGGMLGANEIVPVAERLGLVRLLDHRVLELVIEEMAAAPLLQASVNASPGSTTDPDWWAGLESLLRAHSGIAERLIIEITESAVISDVDYTRGFVARAKDLGCRIAIDDFGAGFTSFRNLRKLGVDVVKIDGAFVQNMLRSDDDRAFVRTLVELGQRLNLVTVAEWVQDERAAKLLEEWGCNYLQGALVGLATTERPWLGALAQQAN
ncbi:MAG TPA: bifunctional diguanylate cyclase/phosphodiesterase [Xanthobacteraceae bacterium]|nr:bifunctional diguanylate cyclase/phosphodiesterase [Xanthobacteraceae bacterium]